MSDLKKLQELTETLVNTKDALKKSEQRFDIVVSNIPDIVYVINKEGIIEQIYGNTQQYGYEYSELLEKPFSIFIHPGDFGYVTNNFSDKFHNDCLNGVSEFRLRTKNGEYRWVRTHYKVIDNKEVGVCTDITYSKELLNALKRSEDKYKRIVEDQTELICRFLPEGLITFTNKAFNTFFEIDKKKIIGKNFFDLISTNSKKEILSELKKLNKNIPTSSIRFQVIKKGITYDLNANYRIIFDELEEPLVVQCVCRDITEQVRLEKILYKRCSLLETVSDNIDAMMWLKDNESRYTFVSKMLAENILNCNPEDAIGYTDFEIIKIFSNEEPDISLHGDVNGVSDIIVKKENKPCRFYEVILRDNKEIWLDVKKSPLKDFLGNIVGIVGVAFDITNDKNDIKLGLQNRIKKDKIKEIIKNHLYFINS